MTNFAELAEKAVQHDVGWLHKLRRSGVFTPDHEFPPAGEPGRWDLHPQEQPQLRALALALKKVRPVKQSATDMQGRFDSRTNVTLLHYFDTRTDFDDLLRKTVNGYVKASKVSSSDQERQRKVQVGCAILLCLALANGDEPSAHQLLRHCPQALHTPLRRRLDDLEATSQDCITPAFMAYAFHRPRALRSLAQHGFDITQPVYFRCREPLGCDDDLRSLLEQGIEGLASSPRFEPMTLSHILLDATARNTLDHVLQETLASVIQMVQDREGQADREKDLLRQAAEIYMARGDRAQMAMFAAFDNAGLLDDPEAVHRLALHLADQSEPHPASLQSLRERLDWPRLAADGFLPVLVLQRMSVPERIERMGQLATMLCRWCAEAGHGALLAQPTHALAGHKPVRLLHELAYYGLTQAVALALDAGADPEARNDRGLTPLDRARRNGHGETQDLLLSFLARREARKLVDECGFDPTRMP